MDDARQSAQWLPTPQAARFLGCSKSTLVRKARDGLILSEVRGHRTYYLVTAAAIRALAKVKRDTASDLDRVEINRALTATGESPESICRRLRVAPSVVCKEIAEIEKMQRMHLDWQRKMRIEEYEHGSPNHPTSWAWVVSKAVGLSFEQVKGLFQEWIDGGGDAQAVSPTVRAALASEAAWTQAFAAWKVDWRAEEERRKAAGIERDLLLTQKRDRAAKIKLEADAAANRLQTAQARGREHTIDRSAKAEPMPSVALDNTPPKV